MSDKDDEKILEVARRRFKAAVDAEASQRRREIEDLRFQVPEFQWDDAAKVARAGGGAGAQATPARPMLSISLIQQPIQLVKNQAAAADLGVNIHPVSEKANKEVAEVKQGLYRRIERDSNAEQVRLWGLDRATQCGRGWYRITTQYDEDGDNEFDQEIVIKRILYQDSVYMDPAAQEPDCRDANWAFQVSWVSLEDFKREYPNSKAAKADTASDWEWLEGMAPDWTKGTGEERSILVAEYWRKIKTNTTLYAPTEGGEPLEEDPGEGKYSAKRSKEKVTLCWYKITGHEVLDEQELDVRWIPLVPIYGRELQPFDGERRFEGMIRPARDGQKLYNFAASSLVERMSLEPKIPYVVDLKSIEGYESWWQQANTRNLPYLPYNSQVNGQVIQAPQRSEISQTGMSLAMMALQEGKGFVQSSTAVYDPSLGETPKHGQSGRAVIAQQQQSDAGTSNYLQNLASISMPYEALVILDWMPKVYDRPGRVVQILGDEDDEKTVMLNAPFVPGQDGRPMGVPPGMQPPQQAKTFNLSEGKYAISVSIGKSYQTRLQQGQEDLSQLLQSLPPDLQLLLLPTYMRFRDTPGAPEVAKLLTKYRDSKFPGMTDDENEQPDAEQLKAKIQSMQQAGQQLQQQLQGAAKQIETDQVKQQAQIEIAKINASKEIELQRMKDATSIAVAQINASVKIGVQQTEAENEALATGIEQAHEVALTAMEQSHANDQMQQGQAFQEAQDQSGQAHEAGLAAMPPPMPPDGSEGGGAPPAPAAPPV